MLTQISRPLVSVPILSDDETPLPNPLDLSGFLELEIVVRVTVAGVAPEAAEGEAVQTPTLLVRHAPTSDAQDWLDLSEPVAVDLTVAGTTWVHVPYFTAFLGLFLSGPLASAATVTLEIVAKH